MDHRIAIVLVYLSFAAAELRRGHFRGRRATPSDLGLDFLSTGIIAFVTSPLVVLGSAALLDAFAPGSRGAWADLPLWAMVGLLLVGDDLAQYAWHRASHSVPFLYTLHRAHHSAPYMSVQIMYRNNLFYYALMPSLWVSGALVHLGLGSVYAGYIVVKLAVIAGAHSSVRWDEPLYRISALSPVMWVVERVISTPSTHSMHHGLHAEDGVTHYAGNYGNLLFLWDVIFGTARITRRYPATYGIEGMTAQPWYVELAWPLFRLRDEAPERAAPRETAALRPARTQGGEALIVSNVGPSRRS